MSQPACVVISELCLACTDLLDRTPSSAVLAGKRTRGGDLLPGTAVQVAGGAGRMYGGNGGCGVAEIIRQEPDFGRYVIGVRSPSSDERTELRGIRLDRITVLGGQMDRASRSETRESAQEACVNRLQKWALDAFSWKKEDIMSAGPQGDLEPARGADGSGAGWDAIPQDLASWAGSVHIVEARVFQFQQDRALRGAGCSVAGGGHCPMPGGYDHFVTDIASGGLGYKELPLGQDGMLLLRHEDGAYELLMLVIRLPEASVTAFRALTHLLYTSDWQGGGSGFGLRDEISGEFV